MDTIYQLIKRKNELPKGNVFPKKIKGIIYFYHQYSLNGVKISKKISLYEANEIKKQVAERKLIEQQIKEILKKGNKDLSLSKCAKELTGFVMKSDKIVAVFDKGQLTWLDETFCPLIIKRTKQLEPFLKYRSIDSGRTNSRVLKKVLNINVKEDYLISLCSYAASISDDYWFKPMHSKLKYQDISFNNDIFFETSLKGLITIYPNKLVLTPELTTNGSYEKGWRNIDGEWWLYKIGTKQEIFSELFYSRLFEKLKLPTAHYEYDGTYILTKNFATNLNFEPMISIIGDDESIFSIYQALNAINHQIALDYLRLCFFDCVLNNIDRHNENTGIMRDKHNGEIISLAPNYDNNLSLISRIDKLPIDKNDGFLKMFIKEINKNKDVLEAYKEVDIPKIEEKIILQVIEEIGIEVDKENIKDFILLRYKILKEEINKQHP